jgi:hypothetical protein
MLKPNSSGPPTHYLVAYISRYTLPEDPDKPKWYMSTEKYVEEANRYVHSLLKLYKLTRLKIKAPSVVSSGYILEMDALELCASKLVYYYQQKIGVLHWAVELGRMNICAEVSMLASYTAAARAERINAMLHIFAFLQHHPRSKEIFDNGYPVIEATHDEDWSELYPDAKEEIPPNVPKALSIRKYGNYCMLFTQVLHLMPLLNMGFNLSRQIAHVIVFKEAGIYRDKHLWFKTATDLVKGLRYKLRVMGILIVGPAHMYVNNMSVVCKF